MQRVIITFLIIISIAQAIKITEKPELLDCIKDKCPAEFDACNQIKECVAIVHKCKVAEHIVKCIGDDHPEAVAFVECVGESGCWKDHHHHHHHEE